MIKNLVWLTLPIWFWWIEQIPSSTLVSNKTFYSNNEPNKRIYFGVTLKFFFSLKTSHTKNYAYVLPSNYVKTNCLVTSRAFNSKFTECEITEYFFVFSCYFFWRPFLYNKIEVKPTPHFQPNILWLWFQLFYL